MARFLTHGVRAGAREEGNRRTCPVEVMLPALGTFAASIMDSGPDRERFAPVCSGSFMRVADGTFSARIVEGGAGLKGV